MVAPAQDVLTDPTRNLRRDLRSPRQIGTEPDVASVEMPHLHLPADHSQYDLEMATTLARSLRSRDLYVTWRSEPGETRRPTVTAPCQAPAPRRRGLARLLGVLAPRRAGF